jgi:hypothetical protein
MVTQIDSYLHVYLERDDLRAFDGELRLVKAFAHYTGGRPDESSGKSLSAQLPDIARETVGSRSS